MPRDYVQSMLLLRETCHIRLGIWSMITSQQANFIPSSSECYKISFSSECHVICCSSKCHWIRFSSECYNMILSSIRPVGPGQSFSRYKRRLSSFTISYLHARYQLAPNISQHNSLALSILPYQTLNCPSRWLHPSPIPNKTGFFPWRPTQYARTLTQFASLTLSAFYASYYFTDS